MRIPRSRKSTPMSPDAYAGFLKLWLTPANRVPAPSADVDAYLRHANAREPLSDETCRAIGRPRKPRAA